MVYGIEFLLLLPNNLIDNYLDSKVINVASKYNNTMVAIYNTSNYLNITGVIFTYLPGQNSGYTITSLLYRKTSPSGRLLYTIVKNKSDYSSLYTLITNTNSVFVKFS